MSSTHEDVKAEFGLQVMSSHARGAIARPPVMALGVRLPLHSEPHHIPAVGFWSRDTLTA